MLKSYQTNLFLMIGIQSEPQCHSTPLTLGDSSNTMWVFLPCSKPNHAATLWMHLSLEKSQNVEHATFHSKKNQKKLFIAFFFFLYEELKIYRYCFGIQLCEEEISSFKVII